MRIAVTGGNGDLGRGLIAYLLEQSHTVVSVDRAMPATDLPGVDYLIADTCDFGALVGCFQGCEALIHLAAFRGPLNHPAPVVYANNTLSSYSALCAAAALGIQRVCLASSINAIGGVYSRSPGYDYFPLDEHHPTRAEDPYSLSKWVLEQQGAAIARRYEGMRIASLRLHMLVPTREVAVRITAETGEAGEMVARHLWGYTLFSEAHRACLLALTADFAGHQVFYTVAPRTASAVPSLELARQRYPETEIRGDLSHHTGFFDCARAAQLLGWRHPEE